MWTGCRVVAKLYVRLGASKFCTFSAHVQNVQVEVSPVGYTWVQCSLKTKFGYTLGAVFLRDKILVHPQCGVPKRK